MRTRRNRLPPLDYLVAFEAAANFGGFTAAAEHLNLSQAAVSRQIRLLEENLGQPLFLRGHRSVRLTAEGQRFLPVVRRALDEVEKGVEALHSAATRQQVSVAATQSVSTLWLMPQLPEIRRCSPDVDIFLVSTDLDREALAGEHDLVILRGDGHWPGYEARLLLDEEVFPVCSRAYAEQKAIREPHDLRHCTLIEVESHHAEWMNWHRWLTSTNALEAAEATSLTFNTYALAVQAAVDGLGVALGWRHLVDHHLADGSLIRPLPQSVRTASGYFLLRRQGRALSRAAEALCDCLFTAAGQGPYVPLGEEG